jgi:hypothetical protein
MVPFARDRYDIDYKKPFAVALSQLDYAARLIIIEAIDALESNPRPSWVKPVPDLPNFYTFPIGSCHIHYEVQDAENDDTDNKVILWELRDEIKLAEQYDRQHQDQENRGFKLPFPRWR